MFHQLTQEVRYYTFNDMCLNFQLWDEGANETDMYILQSWTWEGRRLSINTMVNEITQEVSQTLYSNDTYYGVTKGYMKLVLMKLQHIQTANYGERAHGN